MTMTMKTSKGRQKIEIKKIENRSRRQVTFSKRRAGLFRCADKLTLLTGAQIAILVRSPGNKLFTYGSHPNVIDRWVFGDNNNDTTTDYTTGSDHNDGDPSTCSTTTPAADSDVEGCDRFWWEEPVPENMSIAELQGFVDALETLKDNVSAKARELTELEEEFGKEFTAEYCQLVSMADGWLNLDQDQDELGFGSFG